MRVVGDSAANRSIQLPKRTRGGSFELQPSQTLGVAELHKNLSCRPPKYAYGAVASMRQAFNPLIQNPSFYAFLSPCVS